MYTGKRFRLKTEIVGIESANYERIAITVPAGQLVRVLSAHDRMTGAWWMCCDDLPTRQFSFVSRHERCQSRYDVRSSRTRQRTGV
jgi:hypothetical protein